LERLDPAGFHVIGRLINETVDFLSSAEQHHTAVKYGIDEELDNMKRTYDSMDSILTGIADRVSDLLPEYAKHVVSNVIFFPQLGFLTIVPLDPITGRGEYEGEGNEIWELAFRSEDRGYYKNIWMREMDEHYGDMYGMIRGRSGVFSFIYFLTTPQIKRLKLSMN